MIQISDDRVAKHRAKMARKAAERAIMQPGWIKQMRMPTLLEFNQLPKTDGKLDLRPKASKNDSPAYRKAA